MMVNSLPLLEVHEQLISCALKPSYLLHRFHRRRHISCIDDPRHMHQSAPILFHKQMAALFSLRSSRTRGTTIMQIYLVALKLQVPVDHRGAGPGKSYAQGSEPKAWCTEWKCWPHNNFHLWPCENRHRCSSPTFARTSVDHADFREQADLCTNAESRKSGPKRSIRLVLLQVLIMLPDIRRSVTAPTRDSLSSNSLSQR